MATTDIINYMKPGADVDSMNRRKVESFISAGAIAANDVVSLDGNQAIDAEGAQTLFELHYLLSPQFSLLLSSGNLNTLDAQFDTGLDIRYQSKKD